VAKVAMARAISRKATSLKDGEMRLGLTAHMLYLERFSESRSTALCMVIPRQRQRRREQRCERHQLLKQARSIRQGNARSL
jgi:hypothetical protein